MSSKSTAPGPIHGDTLFSRKFMIITAFTILIIFFATIVLYPFIFSPENHDSRTLMAPDRPSDR